MTTKENPLTISSHTHVKYDNNMAETWCFKTYVYTVTFHLYTLPSSFLHVYSIYSYVVDFIDGILRKTFQPQITSLFHRGRP